MRDGVAGQHVRAHVGEDHRDVAQQVQAVDRLDVDLHLVGRARRRRFLPLHLDDALGVLHELLGVRAIGAMHRHTAAARHEAQDLVARHRVATARQAHEHIVDALHDDAVRAVRFAALRRDDARDHGGHDTGARLGLPKRTGPRFLVPVVDEQL